MDALFINSIRNGYSPDQCGPTLRVADLIEILQQYDDETPVYIRNDNGYTYGNIQERDINHADDLNDEF